MSSTHTTDSPTKSVSGDDVPVDAVPYAADADDDAVGSSVWFKLDVVVLPVAVVLYFLSSLVSLGFFGPPLASLCLSALFPSQDRSNIANAAIAGLLKDLKMTPYNVMTPSILSSRTGCRSLTRSNSIPSLSQSRLCTPVPSHNVYPSYLAICRPYSLVNFVTNYFMKVRSS